jgi:hypothetical protein
MCHGRIVIIILKSGKTDKFPEKVLVKIVRILEILCQCGRFVKGQRKSEKIPQIPRNLKKQEQSMVNLYKRVSLIMGKTLKKPFLLS